MADEARRATWGGREVERLSDVELADAEMFCEAAYDTLRDWAPVAIWAFFSERLSELTVERAKRMGGAPTGRETGA